MVTPSEIEHNIVQRKQGNYTMAKCKCKGNPRIASNVVQSMKKDPCKGCFDICNTPLYGDPNMLGVYTPLIYDEIGVNLCATFNVGTDIPTTFPSASKATIRVLNAAYTYGPGTGNVTLENIDRRKNCYRVTLSNLTITFLLQLYDSSCHLLTTLFPTAVYLPSDITAPTYDEDTNPSSIELELYAPYGITYDATTTPPTPRLNFVGETTTTNRLSQGVNLFAFGKVLDLSVADSNITVGLTLVLQSLYYAGYKVRSHGKIDIPKGSIITTENSECMKFVAGDLLNLSIKPLDLGDYKHEEEYKTDCEKEVGYENCCPSDQS